MTTTHDNSLHSVLADDYLGIGAIGKDAIAALWGDFAAGRQDDYIAEQGLTEVEWVGALLRITNDIIREGRLHHIRTPQGWQPQ